MSDRTSSEKYLKVGDILKHENTYYIISVALDLSAPTINTDFYVNLVNLETGNLFTYPLKVQTPERISFNEISRAIRINTFNIVKTSNINIIKERYRSRLVLGSNTEVSIPLNTYFNNELSTAVNQHNVNESDNNNATISNIVAIPRRRRN